MFIVPVSATLHRRALHRPHPTHTSARASSCGVDGANRVPRLDVVESDAAYSVVLDMPGVAKDQLDVQVDGRCVSVSTKATAEPTPEPGTAGRRRAR